MSDSSDIDGALLAKLGADVTLLSYCSNGVFWDEAPPNSTKFVIVSLVDEVDAPQFGSRAYEDHLYQVKAVALSSAGVDIVKNAAARIDALLENGTLTVAGYTRMTMHRETRVRQTEVDALDAAIRWYHRGGQYRVVMSL